jgi:hypothetical protein
MTDETTPQDGKAMSPASAGSASEGSLAAYLKWRDAKIAARETDVNPFMVWSAGVRYAIEAIQGNDRFSAESGFLASENAGIAENRSESTAFLIGKAANEGGGQHERYE